MIILYCIYIISKPNKKCKDLYSAFYPQEMHRQGEFFCRFDLLSLTSLLAAANRFFFSAIKKRKPQRLPFSKAFILSPQLQKSALSVLQKNADFFSCVCFTKSRVFGSVFYKISFMIIIAVLFQFSPYNFMFNVRII